MKFSIRRTIFKILKITGISIVSILLLLFLIPILFPGTVAEQVKKFTNENLNGEMNFSKVRLSFFNHFPSLTVSLYDFSLKGSAPFKSDTLVAAKKIGFGINLKSLIFDKKIRINKIFLDDANLHVLVNEKGEANYNVYQSKPQPTNAAADTASTALRLERIKLENCHLVYDDRSLPMLIDAKGFNYLGNGDLSKSIFDLHSQALVDSLDFSFNGEHYLKNKKLDAELITQINTNSLAFLFQKNNLVINKLPVQFNGKLDFLKNGYDLDFTVLSTNSKLDDFVTALPPQYIAWQKNAEIKGLTDIKLTLKGQYIAASNSMPDLAFDMKIRDGYVKYDKATLPASNIFLNLQTKMPAIDPDSLQVKVDSVFFNVDKDYLSAIISTKGIANPYVDANINASMDLEKLDQAFGIQTMDLKGKCDVRLTAKGLYAAGPNPKSKAHESVLQSIPAFNLKANIRNGYFKYSDFPQSVSNISFDATASCANQDYKNTGFSINNLSAVALNNFIKGNVSVSSLKDLLIDANLQTNINLAEIKNICPIPGLDLQGQMKCNITAKGKYDAAAKKFPLTVADISVHKGSIKTSYYPDPVTDIELQAKATNSAGNLAAQELQIQPVSFVFEGKPFEMQASLKNFEDILYDVKAKGELDLAKIYKVFSRKDLDITGFVKTDLRLQGRQSDAMNNRFTKLNNEGTLELKDVSTTSGYLPRPFVIKDGQFKFRQDKMWFKQFNARYGQSDLHMNGYLQNVIGYALADNSVLKGNFHLQSNKFIVDEWMAAESFNDTTVSPTAVTTGVVVIPTNLDLIFTADAKQVDFKGVKLSNAKGNLEISKGQLTLKQTGFTIIGSETLMDAAYSSQGINKASFDFHIVTKEFDVKKAYDSVRLFHDMATAAGKSQGIISLDYKVKGKLDAGMKPIYPSLEGGGVLSVKKVKVKGFKLFTAVSRKTGKDSIANPDLSKVDIKSTIKNNLIKVERFKIKMAGFRLRMEGQTSFDGRLNLKLRLGLPPLGIIGIPMNIKGTQDNPIVKLGRGGKDELQETEYQEEDPIKQ